MKKANSYNWILRIVDNNGERYELKSRYIKWKSNDSMYDKKNSNKSL